MAVCTITLHYIPRSIRYNVCSQNRTHRDSNSKFVQFVIIRRNSRQYSIAYTLYKAKGLDYMNILNRYVHTAFLFQFRVPFQHQLLCEKRFQTPFFSPVSCFRLTEGKPIPIPVHVAFPALRCGATSSMKGLSMYFGSGYCGTGS